MAAAARVLNITAAAIAQQIHTLERELGVPLIVRVGRTVRMTEEGARILDRARNLARDFADLRSIANDNTIAGELRLGACTTALVGILPEVLARMVAKFPNINVYAEPTNWDGPTAAADLQTVMTQHPNVNGIYMQAGGVFLAPTLQVLKSAGKLVPAGQPGHISIVSNDGIPQEYAAIRAGQIDATVSQPADLYAQYALFYAQAALAGKTFKVGPTDHNSNIVSWGDGNLEDQLPAPLVTKANVDDKSLWGNQIGQS